MVHLLSGDEIRVSPDFYNNYSNITWIIKTGLSLDLRDSIGRTPLICSVLNTNVKTSLALVKAGANINIFPPGRSNYLPINIIIRREQYYQRIGCAMGLKECKTLKGIYYSKRKTIKIKLPAGSKNLFQSLKIK